MVKKKPKKNSDKALLAAVRKEMARPRLANSARQDVANTTAPVAALTYSWIRRGKHKLSAVC